MQKKNLLLRRRAEALTDLGVLGVPKPQNAPILVHSLQGFKAELRCIWWCAGDALSRADCCILVQRLQETQLCFSCAHGRPTMAPLADLSALRRLSTACGARMAGSFIAGAPAPGDGTPNRIETTSTLCDKMNRILAT